MNKEQEMKKIITAILGVSAVTIVGFFGFSMLIILGYGLIKIESLIFGW